MLIDFSYDFKFFIDEDSSIIIEEYKEKKFIDINYENILAFVPNAEEKFLLLKDDENKKIIKIKNKSFIETILNIIKNKPQEWVKFFIDGYTLYLCRDIFEKFSTNFWEKEKGLMLSKIEKDNIVLYIPNKADYIVINQILKTIFIDINCSLIVKYPAETHKDIKFIWVTRGEYGDIKIISQNRNYISFKEILIYKERFKKISPIFGKAKICDSGCIKNLPRNWKYEYLGDGNNLLIHSSVYEKFKREIKNMKSEEIYNLYLEKVFKVLS